MAETLNIFKYATVFALIISFQFLIVEGRKMKSLSQQEVAAIREKSQKDMANQGGKNTINVHQNNAAQSTETSQPVVTPSSNTLTDHQSLAGKQEMAPTLTTDTSSVSTLAKNQDEFKPLTPTRGVGHPSEPEESVEEGIDSKVSNTKSSIGHFLRGQNDEFNPTQPGHSPGVGHVFQAKIAEPEESVEEGIDSKVLNTKSSIDHFLTGKSDEFHPTQPGHSPGVGHVFQTKIAEPEESVEEGIDSKVSTTKSSIYHFLTGQIDEFHPTHTGDSPGVGHVFQTKIAEPKE